MQHRAPFTGSGGEDATVQNPKAARVRGLFLGGGTGMAIVAKKRGGLPERERLACGGRAARWKRVVPWAGAAVLLALVALLAWRAAGRRPAAEARASAAPDPLWGRTAPPSELKPARTEPRLPAAGEPPAPTVGGPATELAAERPEVATYNEGGDAAPPVAGKPPALPEPPKREKPKRTYPTIAESVISGFANTRPGYPPPAMLRLPTAESIEEILDTPIEIMEDDDEATVALKENCARMKEEIKAYIADGGTAENFLLWYHNELTKDYNDWRASQQRIVQLLKDGELEEAERFAEEANADFAARGIRSVTLPQRLVERITGE